MEMKNTFPVHEVSAWTGKSEDESPLCGADKNDAAVWGYRTVETEKVTCPKCLELRERWADMHDGESDAVSGSLHTRW